MASFSEELQELLSSKKTNTLGIIIGNFKEKSFALLLLILMAVPALPIPTGGLTHIFEIIVALLAIELIIGRKTVWLPKRWLEKPLPKSLQTTALPRFIKIIKWIEKLSRPRFAKIHLNSLYLRFIGLIVLAFTTFAFIAPPFSGLDTLLSMGVVLIALGIIFEDILLTTIGIIIGSVGIGLVITLGTVALKLL